MLTLTENAATAIGRLVASADSGTGAGIRILSAQDSQPSGMEVQFVTQPEPGDEIVEQAGARVFLDSEAASALTSKELDAEVSDEAVKFTIRSR